MFKTTEVGCKHVMVALGVGLDKFGTVHASMGLVRKALEKYGSWMDSWGKNQVLKEAEGIIRKWLLKKGDVPRYCAYNFVEVMKAFNRAYARTWAKTRRLSTESGMKLRRGMDDPIVFYLVSKHQKPQKAHKDLQGKLLVDMHWRQVVDSSLRGRVLKKLKKENIRTVQWAMGAPHYLLTRRSCRHFLIPVRTDDALEKTLTVLNNNLQRKPSGIRRPITDEQRKQAYLKLRMTILSELQSRCRKKNRTVL